MDLQALRDEVIEATTRFFWDKQGFVPADDSDEWEAQYRREFEAARKRHAGDPAVTRPAAPRPTAPAAAMPGTGPLPELIGAPAEQRWAATVREDRLAETANPEIRAWLARDWTRAKAWIDTRALAPDVFQARAVVWHAEHRRTAAQRARAQAAERQTKNDAADAVHHKVAAAGVTAEGLLELVDLSARTEPAALAGKLAEFTIDKRTLRVFETADPGILLVKEKSGSERSEYGIESDSGLVADLKLFTEGQGV